MYDCQNGEIERIRLQITVWGGNVAQASLSVHLNESLNVFKFKICKGRLEKQKQSVTPLQYQKRQESAWG